SAIFGWDKTLHSWQRAYQSYNCLALPVEAEEMPLPLQIAAASNVLLANFKIADQIADSGSAMWRAANAILDPTFKQAAIYLERWGFPMQELWQWFDEQLRREAAPRAGCVDVGTLHYYAEPTAEVTALIFDHSAKLLGTADDGVRANM